MLYSYQRRSSDGRANHLPKRELFRLRLSSSTGLKQSMQPSFYLPNSGFVGPYFILLHWYSNRYLAHFKFKQPHFVRLLQGYSLRRSA